MSELGPIAEELYGVPLSDFIAARNERSDALKPDDQQLARQVRALRKPSPPAWAANMLVRHRAMLVDELADLGAALREAQHRSDGAAVRSLEGSRRSLLGQAREDAATLAQDRGQPWGAAAASGLDETIRAAVADEDAESAAFSGVLVRAISASGFAPVDLDGAVAGDGATRVAPQQTRPAATRPQRAEAKDSAKSAAARKAVDEARDDLATARRELAERQRERAAYEETYASLKEQRATLNRQIEELDDQIADATAAARGLRRRTASAERAVGAAERSLDRATARLD